MKRKKKYVVTALVSLANERTFPAVSYFCVLNWRGVQYSILSRVYFLKVRRPVYV